MSDIRKCTGFVLTYSMDCPLRDNCLWYTMLEDKLFSKYMTPAYNPNSKSCWNLMQAQKGEE